MHIEIYFKIVRENVFEKKAWFICILKISNIDMSFTFQKQTNEIQWNS